MYVACLALIAGTSGCIGAFSLRAHGGVVADEVGRGVQVGVGIGFGASTSNRAGVVASTDVVSGNSPKFGVAGNLDYVHVYQRFGWRAGVGGTFPIIGDRSLYGLHAAGLFVLASADDDAQTLLQTEYTHSARTLGLELAVGRIAGDSREDGLLGGSVMISFATFSFMTTGPRRGRD
jgi:hypothetical protein